METKSTRRHTAATAANTNLLGQSSRGPNLCLHFSFSFCEPRTDLPFDHSPPCPVHLFHLNVLKVSYVEGLVHKGSRSCLEECTYTVGGAGACCMFPSRGRRLDLQAPDSAEGGLKKKQKTKTCHA